MRLSSLIASNDDLTLHGADVDIHGLTEDSRKVKPGFLFIAIPGTQQDGQQFVADALARGASAVVLPAGAITRNNLTVPTVTTSNIRAATAALAAGFYPQQPATIVAITGTSGKTSTAQFTREIWQHRDHASASIGTLGFVTADGGHYGSLTTPDAITLHHLLHDSAHDGITHVAMEASSHGLALHRLDYVRLKAGGFTNFSRDHLDYHQTMDNYLDAKTRLFSTLLPPGSAAVLNADIPEFPRLAELATARGLKMISYGAQGRDLHLIATTPVARGQMIRVTAFGTEHEVLLPVIGHFQAWNALCALGLVVGSGEDIDQTIPVLGKLSGVPGRLQFVGSTPNGASVFVDYAHKPDALENVLRALRPHVAAHKGAKLGVVLGCGGNRDKGKRPIMGEIATRLADWVIVTDDNPRHEDPATIRREIIAGCGTGAMEVADRAKAITAAIEQLHPGDILIIAGKGHENGQIVGDQTLPFDDAEIARKVLGL